MDPSQRTDSFNIIKKGLSQFNTKSRASDYGPAQWPHYHFLLPCLKAHTVMESPKWGESQKTSSTQRVEKQTFTPRIPRQCFGHPPPEDIQASYLGPQDLWNTEQVNPTLYDPEASRACSFPIFIHSKATIQITVISSEFVYLKKKNRVRAHSYVLWFSSQTFSF